MLVAAAKDDRLGALYVKALTTGMREGELLALRWRDVDLDVAVAAVRSTLYRGDGKLRLGEPKTARSRRSVNLAPEAVAALRHHRERQSAERLRLGPAWEDNDLVFANEVGRLVHATAGRGGPPEDGVRDARPRHGGHHPRHLQPRHPGDASRCRGSDVLAAARSRPPKWWSKWWSDSLSDRSGEARFVFGNKLGGAGFEPATQGL
jgi:integrase